MRLIFRVLWFGVYPILKLLEPRIQRWVKPANQSLVLGIVADLTRGRSELVLENAFLGQQVIVLSRDKKRPPLNRLFRTLCESERPKDTLTEQIKTSASIHLTFDELEAIDLAFGLAITPRGF